MRKSACLFFGVVILTLNSVAQTFPAVSVIATDPNATEPGSAGFLDTGTFTITREGPTNLPLLVFFSLGGTASNGVDYSKLESPVTIPEGARGVPVTVVPLSDNLAEGEERVILRLDPSPLVGPGSGYILPTNRTSAIVIIRDVAPTNLPPRTVVTIAATDPEGSEIPEVPPGMDRPQLYDPAVFTVTRTGILSNALTVSYTIGGTALNGVDYVRIPDEVTIPAGAASARIEIGVIDDALVEGPESVEITVVPPVCVAIFPPPPECYLVGTPGKAVAFIRDNDPVPTNNLPPFVQIVRPISGSEFRAPANIHIVADTVDRDGWVGMVEFFANDDKIGESIINFIVAPPDGTPITHEFDWKEVRAGDYALTARATDDQGATSTSLPVKISVIASNAIPPRTTVTIVATDPEGSEIPEVPPGMGRPQLVDPAIFTVTRTGVLSNALHVRYVIGGTASNGVDYVELPGALTIPEGRASAQIEVNVIDDLRVEGPESVVITLVPPPCIDIFPPPPECYVVGVPGRAEARIRDNDLEPTNKPPVVAIVVPTNGAVFVAPADILIVAQAFDSDGYVDTVEFFAGTNSLAIATNNPLAMNIINPFHIRWEDAPPGEYPLTALATDNDGAQSRSRPVWIKVIQEPVRQTVVNIRAIDPEAAEQDPRLDSLPNNAVMRVTRSGPTDFDLTVFYRVEGTAENGVDYVELKGELVIPKDAESADIIIQAIDDKLVERTESVVVGLVPPICPAIFPPPRECYVVGPAGRAMAFILDDEPLDTNLPPHVEITRPASGSTFRAPADIQIVAKTVDRDGYVGKVEFFANNHKIGEASKLFLVPPPDGEPIEYDFEWKDVRPGQYALTARAIDDEGASSFSAPVRISVVGTNEPPPTNVAVVTVYAIDAYATEGPVISVTNSVGVVEPHGVGDWSSTNFNIRPYTNVAVFEIRRSGNFNSSLRVHYEMHGTASEGVDYLDLPGIAEIPAGARSARVVIVPIDDRLREGLESVIICLRPSPEANILPGYVVGRPSQAAAVIVDNDVPPPPAVCLRDGVFQWCRPASNGQCFRVECSTDLKEWMELCTVQVTEGAVHYVDAESLAYDRRFYRAIPVPCPLEPGL